jgi:site-specific recombinase XerD
MSNPLLELLPSWTLALRAERKSPATVKSYEDGVNAFLRWCESTGRPPELTKANAQAFVADLLAKRNSAKTASARLMSIRRFSAWLAAEGEIADDQIVSVKQPKLDTQVVKELSDDELRGLIKACQGRGFTDRRDEAIVRLMAETGLRAGEMIGLTVDDVDLGRGLAIVTRGKGGKGRVVSFGPQAAAAIDRYMRMRRSHRLANTPPLWLGADNWRVFNYFGLRHALQRRAEKAGIEDFHPHKLRHTAATRWLRAGGSEGGLMAMAGWSSRAMLDRYTAHSASERAAAEARQLNLGDL